MRRLTSSTVVLAIALLASCDGLSAYPDRYGSSVTFELESVELGDSRSITVVLPNSYDSDSMHPVLYVLDGDWNVLPVTRIVRNLTDSSNLEAPLLVFIGNGDGETRESDYMHPEDYSGGDATIDAFYRFVTTELLPNIDARYATDPNRRSIIGHSAAGYFVVYALLNDDGADSGYFSGYCAVSPPVFWADGLLFDREDSNAVTLSALPRRLAIGLGSLEGVLFNVSVEEFATKLAGRSYEGFESRFSRLSGVSHFSCEYLFYEQELPYVLGY